MSIFPGCRRRRRAARPSAPSARRRDSSHSARRRWRRCSTPTSSSVQTAPGLEAARTTATSSATVLPEGADTIIASAGSSRSSCRRMTVAPPPRSRGHCSGVRFSTSSVEELDRRDCSGRDGARCAPSLAARAAGLHHSDLLGSFRPRSTLDGASPHKAPADPIHRTMTAFDGHCHPRLSHQRPTTVVIPAEREPSCRSSSQRSRAAVDVSELARGRFDALRGDTAEEAPPALSAALQKHAHPRPWGLSPNVVGGARRASRTGAADARIPRALHVRLGLEQEWAGWVHGACRAEHATWSG